jgi:hypothetical protein
MKASRFALGAFLFAALSASAAMAQQRTFVSGLGNDMNPCTRTAPCRNFAQAILATSAGGEVIVLDSAGYGTLTEMNTITKSISLIAPLGVYAGISVFSGDGIHINTGSSDTVILRGLTVNNEGSSGDGIDFLMNGTLHIESCVVNGFSDGVGVFLLGSGKVEVKDSILRGNSNAMSINGPLSVTLDQVRFEANKSGLDAIGGAQITVRNSVASSNSDQAFSIASGGPAVELNIESCVVSNNFNGIVVNSGGPGQISIARVSNSTVTNNVGSGLVNRGSTSLLLSRGNNTVEGNGTDTSGTIGSYTPK